MTYKNNIEECRNYCSKPTWMNIGETRGPFQAKEVKIGHGGLTKDRWPKHQPTNLVSFTVPCLGHPTILVGREQLMAPSSFYSNKLLLTPEGCEQSLYLWHLLVFRTNLPKLLRTSLKFLVWTNTSYLKALIILAAFHHRYSPWTLLTLKHI